jgi:hypothetical protein
MSEPTEAAKKKIPIWVWIVGGVLVLAGLGSIVGGNDEQAPQQEESISEEETPPVEEQSEESETILLSEAFCNDLESGLSLFQIYEGGLSSGAYETPEEFADLAYGFAATTCEDQLTDNEGLRGYLESWGVDPDTGGDISSSSDYTTGEKLAIIEDRWDDMELYDRRFQQVAERCPNNEESALGDAIYMSTQLLDERAITEDSMWAMETLLAAIAPSEAGTFDCVEVLALAVSLRVEQGP